MSEFDAGDALEKIGHFEGERLAICGFGEQDSTLLPTKNQTKSIFQKALEVGFSDLLLYRSYQTYEEPHYATVEPWIDGLGEVSNDKLKRIIIGCEEEYVHVGNITPLLTQFTNLTELFVIGRSTLNKTAHQNLERLSLANEALTLNDAENIGALDCPTLKYLTIRPTGRSDGPPDGFGRALINSIHNNSSLQIKELIINYSYQGYDIIESLCETGLIKTLDLLHIGDNELSDDPEASVQLLLEKANELKLVKTLRVPLEGYLDDERSQIEESIPGIINSNPPYPESPAWKFPFNPDQYDFDKFGVPSNWMATL